MKYAYYPGCSARSTCKELATSMERVAAELGLELVTLEAGACTGSREIRGANRDLFLTLNARTMALAEQMGLPLMTICNTCTLNFLDTKKTLAEDAAALERVNAALAPSELVYRGVCEISHFLWVLLDDIGEAQLRRRVVRPLQGMRIAAFYGCHIVRPPAHFGFVDARNVRSIETINEILGCDSIDYSGRTECCGFHTAASNEKVAIKLTGRHIKAAKDNGADAVVTPCPLCHTVLDTLQPQMEKDIRAPLKVPILHLPQLIGLALGLGADELALSSHMISAKGILDALDRARPQA